MSSAPIETPVRLIYESKPFYKRPAFIPTLMTVSGIGTVVILLILSSIHRLADYGPVATLVILSAGILALYLVGFTRRWINSLCRDYTLAVTNSAIIYSMRDRVLGKLNKVVMPFSRIEHVEYFVVLPYPSMCFHLPDNGVVDVPIWVMTEDPSPILSVLMEKHVRTVNGRG